MLSGTYIYLSTAGLVIRIYCSVEENCLEILAHSLDSSGVKYPALIHMLGLENY